MLYPSWVQALGLLLVAGSCIAVQSPQKPHLVLIVADDLGWNDVSWHNGGVVSPHLGRLASEGVVLNRSYVQPICSPTRSALLASRYPFTIGRQGHIIGPMEPTGLTLNATILPQELKNLGYDTHAVGKWHLGFCKWAYTPTFRGFDSFYGFYVGAEDYYNHTRSDNNFGDSHESLVSGYDFRNDTSVNRTASGNYSAFLFSDRVDFLLRARSPEKPLFLYVPFQSVHAPLQVPENYSNIYKNISNYNRRTYLGMVSALDDAVGRIISSLKNTGHYNNSVIVFTTDNGGPTISGSNNWPLRGNKTTLWEGGTRGSAFIHSPLLANPGTVSNRLIHVTDWYPTFVHLAGGTAPSGIDGVNQWESLNNESLPDARDYFVYDINEENGMRIAIRWGRYKLIVGDPGPSSWTPPPNLQKSRAPIRREQEVMHERRHPTDRKMFFDSSHESDKTVKADRANRNSEKRFKDDIENTDLGDARESNSRSVISDNWSFDFLLQRDKIKSKSTDGYRQDVIEEDSNENSIFPEKKYESNNFDSRFGKFPFKTKTQDMHSHAFINIALKYFKDNNIDIQRLLYRDRNTEDMAVDDFVKDLVASYDEIDWLFNSIHEQSDKSSHREMKRRYRLASGVAVRLTDFENVQDMLDSNVAMQLYDVEDDPTERLDLVKIRRPVVELMLARLQLELPRYTPPDVPADDGKSNPDNFDGAWSPGWC